MEVNRTSPGPESRVMKLHDLHFETTYHGADYTSKCSPKMTDRILHNLTACVESTILFAAREGWISSIAPKCTKDKCYQKDTSSVLAIRKKRSRDGSTKKSYVWRFRCCHRRSTILKNSMFFNSSYGPAIILEILWKMCSRTPVSMIPRLILGKESSEIYK